MSNIKNINLMTERASTENLEKKGRVPDGIWQRSRIELDAFTAELLVTMASQVFWWEIVDHTIVGRWDPLPTMITQSNDIWHILYDIWLITALHSHT